MKERCQPSKAKLKSQTKQNGFNLLELMIVMVILGLIAGIVGPQAMKYLGKGKTKSAKVQIENISSALDLYRLEVGRYPSSGQGLSALIQAPSNARGWSGPYLKKSRVPVDPWGNDYYYKRPGNAGQAFELASLGADGSQGGQGDDADISLWDE